MAEEPPTGDKAVFAFLELVALAFMFEGVSAFLNGKPLWELLACAAAALFFFVAGVKWPWLKTKLGATFISPLIRSRHPLFWLLAGAFAGIFFYVAITSLIHRTGATTSATEGNPIQTSVRTGKYEFTYFDSSSIPTSLKVGSHVAMNIGIQNFGPLPALDASFVTQIKWLPVLTKSVEDDAWEEFRQTAVSKRKTDLNVNDESWQTFESGPLSEDDIHDIGLGKKTLYVFLYYQYRDGGGQHSTESCTFLQTPVAPQGPVWHICIDHNKIR